MEDLSKINLRNRAGFTLLELMISILIVSIGMLGVQTMFAMRIKNNSYAKKMTAADQVAVGLIEDLRNAPYFIASQGVPNSSCNLPAPNDNIVDCLRPDNDDFTIPGAPYDKFKNDLDFVEVEGILVKRMIKIETNTPQANMKKITVQVDWKDPAYDTKSAAKVKSIIYTTMRDRGVK